MSSSKMSLACLSEARSTIRRARLSASALSAVERGSSANGDWLSMPATITPRVPTALRKLVNGSHRLAARFIEGESRGGSIEKRGSDRFVDGHLVSRDTAADSSQQHLANLARHVLELEGAVAHREQQVARL